MRCVRLSLVVLAFLMLGTIAYGQERRCPRCGRNFYGGGICDHCIDKIADHMRDNSGSGSSSGSGSGSKASKESSEESNRLLVTVLAAIGMGVIVVGFFGFLLKALMADSHRPRRRRR